MDASSNHPTPSLGRVLATSALLSAVYFVAGRLGLSLAFFHNSATPVWPPTGIALAAMLVLGVRYWPAIFVGAFLVNITTSGAWLTSGAIAAGNTLEAVVGGALVRRFARGARAFERPRHILLYALLAGFFSTALGASIGVASLVAGSQAAASDAGTLWLTWWLGDAGGALVVAPLIVSWTRGAPVPTTRVQLLESLALAVAIVLVGLALFGGFLGLSQRRYPLAFLCIPPILWAAFRLGARGTAGGLVLLSYVAIAGTLRGFGPFAREDPNESLLLLQAFLGVISVLALAMAATVEERRTAEATVRSLNQQLEGRVDARTRELREVNARLRTEVQEHTRTEEALRRSETRLREAQSLAQVGSWEWDVVGNRVEWSDELYRIYGLEPGSIEITFEDFLERVHPEDRDRVEATVRAAYADRRPFAFEHRIVRPDDTVIVLQAQGTVVTDASGQVVRMVGVGQDVTARKRAEEEREELAREQMARQEAEEANRLKDEFLSTLSHELRTPLHAITGWAQLLREDRLDPESRTRAIETIVRNARVQGRLISDILDLSRMDSGKLQLALRAVDPAAALEAALDTMRPAADEKGIRLLARLEEPLPRLLADPERLHQVICNLISNGIKFTPPGGEVFASARVRGDEMVIRVEDDGPGIDPSFLPLVFERFRQRDSSSTRRHGGLGLGLAIVKGLVELHGGRIQASNRPEGGACFAIVLPLAPPRDERDPPKADGEARGMSAGTALAGLDILVVEDDPDGRDLVVAMLSRHGARVRAAPGAGEAMRLLAERPADLLVSDLEMPGENGYQLIARIRAMEGPVGAAPALALTAYTDTLSARQALEAGYQAHLGKPVQAEVLIGTLVRLAGRRAGPTRS